MKRSSLLTSTLLCAALWASFALTGSGAEISVDVRPVPVKTPPPTYPQNLRREGVDGVVAVKVTIDEAGNVSECTVSKSTRQEFEEPALAAVRNWKFKPASKAGAAVAVSLIIPIRFSVETS